MDCKNIPCCLSSWPNEQILRNKNVLFNQSIFFNIYWRIRYQYAPLLRKFWFILPKITYLERTGKDTPKARSSVQNSKRVMNFFIFFKILIINTAYNFFAPTLTWCDHYLSENYKCTTIVNFKSGLLKCCMQLIVYYSTLLNIVCTDE